MKKIHTHQLILKNIHAMAYKNSYKEFDHEKTYDHEKTMSLT